MTLLRSTFNLINPFVDMTTQPRQLESSGQSARYQRLGPDDLTGPEPLTVTDLVLHDIDVSVGSMPAEQGGMLGGRRTLGTVTNYRFDDAARRTSATYSPDARGLNQLLREEWNPNSVDLLGFVHSHPSGFWRPSQGDVAYAERILAAIPDMDRLLLPIAQTEPDTGQFKLHPFVATRRLGGGVQIDSVPLNIVAATPADPTIDDAGFDRVRNAYDLELMAHTRLVVVGVGGAAAFAESMARAGVGEFVLIDPDIIELPNVGTQQVYRNDIGRAKIDAVAERILDVNPHARVVGLQVLVDDLTDDMVRRLARRPLPNANVAGPTTTVLCGFTDSFWAQARVNRLALHLGVPMLAAQVYREGRGVEVAFTVPGVTPACGRCVLGNRYRAHLDRGYQNQVTSHGTPLWATERLNALKAEILLAIVHGTAEGAAQSHPARARYAALLGRIASRNLVVARLDYDIAATLGMSTFDKAFAGADAERVVTDETLWLQQAPENEATGFAPCGDCGGTGDLTACAGMFTDTRLRPIRATSTPEPAQPPADAPHRRPRQKVARDWILSR